MTLLELIREANGKGAMVSLLEREDGHWQCNLNAKVNRLFFVCHVLASPEEALLYCLGLWEVKVQSQGIPIKLESSKGLSSLDIDELLAGL